MTIARTTFDEFDGISAPSVAPSGKGRVYFDSTAKKFKRSEDGNPYIDANSEMIAVAISDETTAITIGTAKVTMHAPYAFLLRKVKAGLAVASSSGLPEFDVKVNNVSVFTTLPTIDVDERFSDLATTPSVLTSNPVSIASGDVITFDIVTAGTGAKGAKIYLLGDKNGPI